MQQKLFQNFFTTRSWSFWKKYLKGIAKATPEVKKIYIKLEQLELEQLLKFSHFEGSIIP